MDFRRRKGNKAVRGEKSLGGWEQMVGDIYQVIECGDGPNIQKTANRKVSQ